MDDAHSPPAPRLRELWIPAVGLAPLLAPREPSIYLLSASLLFAGCGATCLLIADPDEEHVAARLSLVLIGVATAVRWCALALYLSG